jgi:uroporphyrinogen III methyltransferase/synthase
VIERGATRGQRVVVGRLDDIAERVRAAFLHPPAVVVVGEVVRLRETSAWYDSGPLGGKCVLMPRVHRRPSELARLLREAEGELTEIPVLRVQAHLPAPNLLKAIHATDWILFASPAGVDALLEQLDDIGEDVRCLAGIRLAAIGPATRAHLRRARLRVDHVCTEWPHSPSKLSSSAKERFSSIIGDWLPAFGGHVLIVGKTEEVEQALAVLSADEQGKARGIVLDSLPVASCTADTRSPLPPVAGFEAVVFASPGTVRCFSEGYVDRPGPRRLVAGMGPSTSAEARLLGIAVDIEAEEGTAAAVAHLIIQRLSFEGPEARDR